MGYTHSPEDFFLFSMTDTLGINTGVNESLGIVIELKIMSQANNSIKQILSLLEAIL
jgi:hypothetical protein